VRITAKVMLNSKMESGVGDNRNVALSFSANYADGKNAEWAIWTPNLALTMTVKGEVADKFVIGQEYTLTFSEDEDKVVVE
jgi:hypothetical protein